MSGGAMAYDFEVGGLYYNIANKTNFYASVTNGSYSGNIIIPNSVINPNDGKAYAVTRIEDSAFKNCKELTSVSIGNNVTSIGYDAFAGCTALTEIVIPDNVTTLGSGGMLCCIFRGCSNLEKATIGSGAKSIGYQMFSNCPKLKYVTLKEGLENIDYQCFSGCNSLEDITIPSTMVSIGDQAFSGVKELKTITVKSIIPPSANTNVFTNQVYNEATLIVYESAIDDYKAHPTWQKFFHIVPTEISNIIVCPNNEITEVFMLDGQSIDSPQKGINVVRMKNGKTKKIIVR